MESVEENVRVRNLKSEAKYTLLVNCIILLLLSAVLMWVIPSTELVGIRNMLILNLLFAAIDVGFATALEKFAVLISGWSEKVIINILSSVYAFVCLCLINGIFFWSLERLMADVCLLVLSSILLSVADKIFEAIVHNPKHYRAPKMLIINSSDNTFLRMKRIKYGVLNAYNSWYESLEGKTAEEVEAFAQKNFGDFDAICMLDELDGEIYNVAVRCALSMGKELFIVPNIIDVGKTNAKPVRFDDVLTLYMPKLYISSIEFFAKRVMDIVISLIGTIVAAIPMLVIALLIKLTSPGPVFYKQERMTKDKKRFMIYKFRTMIPDAEKLTGPKFAEKDDPRITKIGKILRSCRLDELPQILNILKGDMSLVGPRPERPVFIEQFEKEIENYDYRFVVKAGLTSLSHVYGKYSTYIHDRTYYDLFYITHYSLLMDLKIMLLTSKTMFIKSAAEGEGEFKEKTTAADA